MRNLSPIKVSSIICFLFFCSSLVPQTSNAQAFNFNTFFNAPAIRFASPDSNNMIYDELHNATEMTQLLDSIFPFYTEDFYGAFPGISVSDNISFLPGLHEQIPAFDDKAAEVKSSFTLNNKTSYWYAYYKKSTVDTTTAIVIMPGQGYHEGFQIANNNASDYHNMTCLIKDKSLDYGDVYITVRPNEDFRSIWKDVGSNTYNKLDYDVMGPYTDFMGKNWAANLYIEMLAQFKYLKTKYKKVIVMGLSSGGFPVLVCGLEAGVDGINCASGISVTSYTGFPLPNNENPYFSNVFNYYSLDHISELIHHSGTNTLFSYGSGDCCTNAYEYNNHAVQNYINTPVPTCNAQFFYNFHGHTFPCVGLDAFFTEVIKSPKVQVDLPQSNCAYESLEVSVKITGIAPFSMDLYKDGTFLSHINTTDALFNISLYDEGEYYLANVVDANNYPLCKSQTFNYTKPTTLPGFTALSTENSFLYATTCPYMYHWYKDDALIDSTTENVLASQGTGQYYVTITDSAGCIFKSNTIIQGFPSDINIYPNPVTDNVNILINEYFKDSWTYVVYNNLGQRITEGRSTSAHTLVNMSAFSRGIYNFAIEFINQDQKKTRISIPVLKQ